MSASGLTPQAIYAASAGMPADNISNNPQAHKNSFASNQPTAPEMHSNFMPIANSSTLHDISILNTCKKQLESMTSYNPNHLPPNLSNHVEAKKDINSTDPLKHFAYDLPNYSKYPGSESKNDTRKSQNRKHVKSTFDQFKKARTNFAPITNFPKSSSSSKNRSQTVDQKLNEFSGIASMFAGKQGAGIVDPTKHKGMALHKPTVYNKRKSAKLQEAPNATYVNDYEDYFKCAFNKSLHEMDAYEINNFIRDSTLPLVYRSNIDSTKYDIEINRNFKKSPNEMTPSELVHFISGYNVDIVPRQDDNFKDNVSLLADHSYAHFDNKCEYY